MSRQTSLKTAVACQGVGVHSGAETTLTLKPAPAHTGYVFIRKDVADLDNVIKGRYDNVTETQLCTVLSNTDGVSVSTVEHVISALAAAQIDNAVIEIDGPEMPIMDGSAAPFIKMIDRAGIKLLAAPKRYLRIKKTVTHTDGDKTVTLSPSSTPRWDMTVDFDSAAIGRQSYSFSGERAEYRTHISDARTFGFLHEVEALKKMGLARGGSLDNAVVIDGDTVMNEGGLRHKNEFARHKLLDAIGDIALCGAPLLGHYKGYKAGHAMNNQILRVLFADPEAYEFIEAEQKPAPKTFSPRENIPVTTGEPAYA